SDLKKLKSYFYLYIAASILTICFYLFKSFDYFVNNLFQIKQSGPATLGHPITAGEIISFTAVFLFAFLVNEKQKVRDKIITALLLIIALAGLYATYKRTGWLGSAAGMGVILLFAKKWKLLIPMAAAILLVVIFQSSVSELRVYDYSNNKLSGGTTIETNGRPYNMLAVGNKKYLADFTDGIAELTEAGKLTKVLNTPFPVLNLIRMNDSVMAAFLIDTRFMLIETGGASLRVKNIITSPGFTSGYAAAGNKLYINDVDSGLTVVDAAGPNDAAFYKEINGTILTLPDTNFIAAFSGDRKSIKVYETQNGLPGTLLYVYVHDKPAEFLTRVGDDLLLGDNEGLNLFKIDSSGLELLATNKQLKNLHLAYINDKEHKLFIASSNGRLYELEYPLNNKLSVISENELGYTPSFVSYAGGKIYAGNVKVGRISSILDIYNPSNFGRLAFWEAGWKMFKDNPFFGVGDIDLANLYKQYKHPYNKEIQGHMHNNYVHILVILGAAGFIILMSLFVKIFLLLLKNYRTLREESFLSTIALGALGSYAAFLVSGLTEWNFGDHEIVTLLWTAIGLSLAAMNIYKTRQQ
ncbi:MAG TPA: O-antigen ligase family protein, partial [Ignavibacteriales bacterium]|nr:O-antigen ligase family protein [Ignavibacteriales bacterium]